MSLFNRLVNFRKSGSSTFLDNQVCHLDLPLTPDEEKGWRPYPLFKGFNKNCRYLTCHVSVLTQGSCPHPPHTHEDEEILLLLQGEVDLVLREDKTLKEDKLRRLKPGQFVYYPLNFPHTLRTVSKDPAHYLMFKWKMEHKRKGPHKDFEKYEVPHQGIGATSNSGFDYRLMFEWTTAYMSKLHCHMTHLSPGAGYDPHADPYDVAIVLLEGEVETLGKRTGPLGVIYYQAGEPHGMRNPGMTVAKYLVFEFHGNASPSFWERIKDPQRWKRKIKNLFFRGASL